MRRRTVIATTIVFVVLALVGAATAVMWPSFKTRLGMAPNSARIQFAGPAGEPIDPGKVTNGGGFYYLPGAHFADDGSTVVDDTLLIDTVNMQLTNPDNLRAWQLCAAELQAQAGAYRGISQAWETVPGNPPWNDKEDVARGPYMRSLYTQQAQMLEYAAGLAARAEIPCVGAQDASNAHSITVNVVAGGRTRPLVVTDYDVMYLVQPTEFYLFTHESCDDYRDSLATLEQRPVPNSTAGLTIRGHWGARTKLWRIAVAKAQISVCSLN